MSTFSAARRQAATRLRPAARRARAGHPDTEPGPEALRSLAPGLRRWAARSAADARRACEDADWALDGQLQYVEAVKLAEALHRATGRADAALVQLAVELGRQVCDLAMREAATARNAFARQRSAATKRALLEALDRALRAWHLVEPRSPQRNLVAGEYRDVLATPCLEPGQETLLA